MPDLLAIQRDIAASLRHADADSQSAQWIAGDAALVPERLAIYRANVAASVTKAMSAAHPVIRQVVGDEFFEALAQAYNRVHPSASGDLHDYGANFAPFLSAFPHTQGLPYLPDLARLEWAVHCAYGAEDAPPWDPKTLEAVPVERQSDIRFDWAAGSALVSSDFPIVRIWTIHQADHEGTFDVDWSIAECAWVSRRDLRVEVSASRPGDAVFIRAMLAQSKLGAAIPAALEADPQFDLGTLLQRLISSNLITRVSLRAEDDSTLSTQTKEEIE